MTRRISIQLGSVSCTAELHDDAPLMTGLLWAALPLAGDLRHVRWSGEAGYVLAAALKHDNPPDERRVSAYGPGQIVLRSEHGELNFCYGQGQARDGQTLGTEVCHIGSIVGNAEEFLARVAQTRRTGRTPVEITRLESD